MTKVKVELVDVYCRDTEDITGADDFYLVGGFAGGQVSKAILTTPIKINDKQKKSSKPARMPVAVVATESIVPAVAPCGPAAAKAPEIALLIF